jgi:hypothetical protein
LLDQRGLFDAFDLNSHVLNTARVDQMVMVKANENSTSDTISGLREDVAIFIENAKIIKQINEGVFNFMISIPLGDPKIE